MPVLNGERFIAESISSVLHQHYSNWELIVIDDGSTDRTEEIVSRFAEADHRVRYCTQGGLRGQGAARNTGIKHAAGYYFAFIDADDYWFPEKLEQQLIFINSSGADLVFADVTVVDENGKVINESWGVQDAKYCGEGGISVFLDTNRIPALTAMVKREVLLRSGGFTETGQLQYGEDYDLWLRLLASNAVFASSSDTLGAYRRHAGQATNHKAAIIQVIKALFELPLTGARLEQEKKRAIKKWIRRYLRSLPDPSKEEIQSVIRYFPGKCGRFFMNLVHAFASHRLSAKVIASIVLHI